MSNLMTVTEKPKEAAEFYEEVKPKRTTFTRSEIMGYLRYDFKIIPLKSGDSLFVRADYKDYDYLNVNALASILAKEPVYGTALLADEEHVD